MYRFLKKEKNVIYLNVILEYYKKKDLTNSYIVLIILKNIIDNVYNNLTYNAKHHVGGQAFLDLCNFNEFNKDDEPFYCGIKYNNMPPMKRYFEISELSGGEKSISALALIFSIQKYINNSFIILDEVDANMDPLKIQSLTRYLNSINSQVIVISLKEKIL